MIVGGKCLTTKKRDLVAYFKFIIQRVGIKTFTRIWNKKRRKNRRQENIGSLQRNRREAFETGQNANYLEK